MIFYPAEFFRSGVPEKKRGVMLLRQGVGGGGNPDQSSPLEIRCPMMHTTMSTRRNVRAFVMGYLVVEGCHLRCSVV